MFKKLVVTFGGLGLIRGIPGTFASLAAAVIYFAVWRLAGERTLPIMGGLTLLFAFLTAFTYPWARRIFATDDPRQFVLDEVVGQWLTLLFMPILIPIAASGRPMALTAAGFFLFRAFDVAKPFPIDRIERIRGWAGVLFDDVAAAIYAGAGLWLLVWLAALVTG